MVRELNTWFKISDWFQIEFQIDFRLNFQKIMKFVLSFDCIFRIQHLWESIRLLFTCVHCFINVHLPLKKLSYYSLFMNDTSCSHKVGKKCTDWFDWRSLSLASHLIRSSQNFGVAEARSVALPSPQCHPAVVNTMKPRIKQVCG